VNAVTRVVAYVRCSTIEQATEGMSLPAQEAKIRAWAEAVGAEVVDVITDGGVSGSLSLDRRPGGRVIADIMSNPRPGIDAIAVMRLDRLGRDAAETLGLLKKFTKGPVGLVSVSDRLDLGSPQGRAMAAMVCVFAELERGLVSQRVKDALQELRRQGRVYGNPPFGWDRRGDFLIRNRREQATLAHMRRLYDSGMTYTEVGKQLQRERRKSKKGGQWRYETVRGVMRASARLDGLPLPVDRVRPPSRAKAKRPPKVSDYLHNVPFGWDVVDGTLYPNVGEQTALVRIRRYRDAGMTYRGIARLLHDNGCPTKRGGMWDHSSVLSVLATAERVAVALQL
jgi:site-specific DNA recombinase